MIDETNLDGMASESEDLGHSKDSLFGDDFVRTGIQRDYIIDLRDSHQSGSSQTAAAETVAAEVVASVAKADEPEPELAESLFAASTTGSVIKASASSSVTILGDSQVLNSQPASGLSGPGEASAADLDLSSAAVDTTALSTNLFERPVAESPRIDLSLAVVAPKAEEPSGSLFPQASESKTLTKPVVVAFQEAGEVSEPAWWTVPAAIFLMVLGLGFGAVKLVGALGGSDDADTQISTVDDSTSVTVPSLSVVTTAAVVAVEDESTTAPSTTQLVATTQAVESTVVTVAPGPAARPVTTRRTVTTRVASTVATTVKVTTTVAPSTQPGPTFAATTTVPTTAAPVTAAPTTAAPVTAAPTTAAPVTAAPTTATPVTAAPTTATPAAG